MFINNNNKKMSEIPFSLHPNTSVQTTNGAKLIKDIKAGDFVYRDNGETIQILYNIKYIVQVKKFILFTVGSLGNNLPTANMYVTPGHLIMYNGVLTSCQQMINGTTIGEIELDNVNVHALCTREQVNVKINGIPVSAWAEHDWNQYTAANKFPWVKANAGCNCGKK